MRLLHNWRQNVISTKKIGQFVARTSFFGKILTTFRTMTFRFLRNKKTLACLVLLIFCALSFYFWNHRPLPVALIPDTSQQVVATFHGGTITLNGLRERILEVRSAIDSGGTAPGIFCQYQLALPENQEESIIERKAPKLAAKDLALEKILFDEAIKKGLAEDSSYLRQTWEYENNLLVDFLAEALHDESKVPEQESQKYFQDHRADYSTPETITVRHIFVNADFLDTPVKRNKREARDQIAEIRNQVVKGEDFGILVQKYSDSESAARRGGRIGPIARGSMDGVIENEIFSLEPGQLGTCVETYSGAHLFIQDSKIPASTPSWTEIKDRVISKLEDESFAELLRKTKEETLRTSDITNRLDRLLLANKPSDLLFRIGKYRFTVDDYLNLYPQSRPDIVSANSQGEDRFDKDALREIFERALLAEAARRRGYADNPDIRKQIEKKNRQLLIDLQFQKLSSDHLRDVINDEAQLRAIYEAEKEKYRTDLRVLVDRITLALPEDADPSMAARIQLKKHLKKQSDEVYELLRKRVPIAELAKYGVKQWRTSDAPQEIQYYEEEIQRPLSLKAESLINKELENQETPDPRVMEPMATGDSYTILRVRQVFPARIRTFEEVRQEIETKLAENKQREIALREGNRILQELAYEYVGS